MTDDQRTLIEEGCAQLESRAGLIWGPEFIEEFAAALRALLAENAALKAKVVHRAETVASLRDRIALIRDATGCDGVMLGDLPRKVAALKADLAQRTAERDEARREACALRVLCTTTSKNCEQIADERGWDCFKKEAKP
jgi:hypothetical protein